MADLFINNANIPTSAFVNATGQPSEPRPFYLGDKFNFAIGVVDKYGVQQSFFDSSKLYAFNLKPKEQLGFDSFYVRFGASVSPEIPVDASVDDIESIVNNMPDVIDAGGVVVTKTGVVCKISFKSVGARVPFVFFTKTNCVPPTKVLSFGDANNSFSQIFCVKIGVLATTSNFLVDKQQLSFDMSLNTFEASLFLEDAVGKNAVCELIEYDANGGRRTIAQSSVYLFNCVIDFSDAGYATNEYVSSLMAYETITTARDIVVAESERVQNLAQETLAARDIVVAESERVQNLAQETLAARDVVVESAEQAQESAIQASESEANAEYWAKQAQAISDPENRIGTLVSQVSTLQTGKVNSSVLHFNNGTLGNFGKGNDSNVFSHCFTMAYSYEDYLSTSGGSTFVGTCMYGTINNGWFLYNHRYQTTERLSLFSYNKIVTSGYNTPLATNVGIKKFFDGTPKKFVIIRDSVNTRLYLDNVLMTTMSVPANGAYDSLFRVGYFAGSSTTFTPFFKGKVSDVAVFNFDITAEGAPYSINDYQNGKPISPYLLDPTAEQRAELALENYTFKGEVLDYSGNGRHGKIEGSVKGDNDTKVETLFEKFSTRISEQTNG